MANRIDRARFDVRGVIIGGCVAGILAGIVMAIAAMLYAAANGSGFWLPVRSIAATWYGANALVGGAGVLIVGMLTHVGTSAFWGGIFAAVPPRRKSVPTALVGGLVWGGGLGDYVLRGYVLAQSYDVRGDGENGGRLVVHFAPDLRRDAGGHAWSRAQSFCDFARCRGETVFGIATHSLNGSKGRGYGSSIARTRRTSEVPQSESGM